MTKSNEITKLQNNPVELNKAFGFEGRPKPPIPLLYINSSDDDEGMSPPKGTFVLNDGDRLIFSTEITIRSFVKAYQYRLFDKDNKANSDMSIIANSFKEEFRSMSGRLACGKMNNKAFKDLGDNVSTQQKYYQDNTKCKLMVFGLVSGAFIDLDNKENIALKDALFMWLVPQSNFMAIDGVITGIAKERRPVPLTPIKLTLVKEKYGSNTYYSAVPSVTTDTVKLEADKDLAHLSKVKDFIKDTNKVINDKYNAATRGRNENDNFAEVAKASDVVNGKAKVVDPFFEDSIPF